MSIPEWAHVWGAFAGPEMSSRPGKSVRSARPGPIDVGAVNGLTTTVSFCAHPDDDLLFMNPDIASDVQAGYTVWVVYLTAGDIPYRPGKDYGGIAYADMRIQGVRAAYARAAQRTSNWTYEQLTLAGHPVATNKLVGTNVRLVFTFVHAAASPEDPCGDLYRMWHDPTFVARPIDGRPAYTKSSFIALIRAILDTTRPDYIRSQSTIGHREGDNVDHVSAALLVADADVDSAKRTRIRRDEYTGYAIQNLPDNVSGYWRNEKTAIWNEYWPHDPELNSSLWQNVMGKQYSPEGRHFLPGNPWVPPSDFNSC
jgi:LmbE family N-acetylglucosaminyl deacetylase